MLNHIKPIRQAWLEDERGQRLLRYQMKNPKKDIPIATEI